MDICHDRLIRGKYLLLLFDKISFRSIYTHGHRKLNALVSGEFVLFSLILSELHCFRYIHLGTVFFQVINLVYDQIMDGVCYYFFCIAEIVWV